MRIVDEIVLVNQGNILSSTQQLGIEQEIISTIESMSINNSKDFIINPTRKGNGVRPIKNLFIDGLITKGWEPEVRMSLATGTNPGPIDAIKTTSNGIIAVEWETGNISSTHRALNKICIGLDQNQILGGYLVLPNKNLARFLTDRIGSYEEISPYFPIYQKFATQSGFLKVFSVEHDSTDLSVPLILKGLDGNARKK